MKTFDFDQVGAALAPLKAKFEECAHSEGIACETLDKQLECCAIICFEVVAKVYEWANGVFSGEIIFDPAAENMWRTELAQIHSRATRIWQIGRNAEVPCWELPGQNTLGSALWELQWILEKWVSPKLSVGPMGRTKLRLTDAQRASIREQIASLPPLQSAVKTR